MLHLVLAALLAGAPGVPVQLPKLNRGSHNSRNVTLRVCPGGCGANLQGSLGEGITFTRASAWTCPNADGTIQPLSSGAPCLPQNVSGGPSFGARARPSVTNLIQFDHSIGTAPWATTASTCTAPTVTLASTDLLDPEGGNAATKLAFPACSGAANATIIYQTYTGTAAAYSAGVSVRTLSGSYTFNVDSDLGGTSGASTSCTAVSTQWTLCPNLNVTETAAAWKLALGFNGGVPGAAAISAGTVYVYGAQTNLGATLSDLCQTAGATGICLAETSKLAAATPGLSTSFCASLDASSGWNGIESDMIGSGTLGANTWFLTYQSGNLFLETTDNASALRYWKPALALTAGTTHHFRVCYDGAGDTPLFWVDGASLAAGSVNGAGTGVLANATTPIGVAYAGNSGIALNGTAGNVCLGNCGAGPTGIAACPVCP